MSRILASIGVNPGSESAGGRSEHSSEQRDSGPPVVAPAARIERLGELANQVRDILSSWIAGTRYRDRKSSSQHFDEVRIRTSTQAALVRLQS
jgi:hypothetical protein